MTELEKMRRGEWYDANYNEDLKKLREETDELQHQFNQAAPKDPEKAEILRRLLGVETLPEGLSINAPVYFDYGSYTRFGKGVFANHGCYFMDGGGIDIGDNAFIGPFCGFYTATHPLQYAERNKGLEKALPIHVGDNCWFGASVSVMPGVTIGSGCVIAAGSVVTEDIPDNALAAGVPAKVKKILP